jgi:hypothetical protein
VPQSFSKQELERLLDLFPARILSTRWSQYSSFTKDETTEKVSQNESQSNIIDFGQEYLDCCKQYVYIYKSGYSGNPGNAVLKDPLYPSTGGNHSNTISLVKSNQSTEDYLYIIRQSYTVTVKSPLVQEKIFFLWPLRVRRVDSYFFIHVVKLSKAIRSYFPNQEVVSTSRKYTNDNLTNMVENAIGQHTTLTQADIHTGVKSLWKSDLIDSPEAQFKTSFSTARQTLNGDDLIKRDHPSLYKEVIKSPLLDITFRVTSSGLATGIDYFRVDAERGKVEFPLYSDEKGDADYVLQEIIDNN